MVADDKGRNALVDGMAGGVAGLCARFSTAPLDVIKIRFQLQSDASVKYSSIRDAFYKIYREEGYRAFWKGSYSATLLWVNYTFIQFGIYGSLKGRFNDRQSQPLQILAAGSIAGMAATAVTYPFDITRTQFVMQGSQRIYHSIVTFILDVFQKRGIRGLYSGLVPALLAVAPQMGANYLIYESLSDLMRTNPNSIASVKQWTNRMFNDDMVKSAALPLWLTGLIGGVAGGSSKLLVYPLDTIKKRIQAQIMRNTIAGNFITGTVRYRGVWDCGSAVVAKEGWRGLYKGIFPTIVKASFSAGVTFLVFEGTQRRMLSLIDDF